MTSGVLIALDLAPQLCAAIARRGQIIADDVGVLSHLPNFDGETSLSEIEALGHLARARLPACADWGRFFAARVGAFYLDSFASRAPNADQARWLIDYLGGEGAELSTAQFRLLMQVMENLTACPEELLSFARSCLVRTMGAEIEAKRGRKARKN